MMVTTIDKAKQNVRVTFRLLTCISSALGVDVDYRHSGSVLPVCIADAMEGKRERRSCSDDVSSLHCTLSAASFAD